MIDSGVDLGHDVLIQKQWTNPNEVEDAVDNDRDDLVDDLHGWNIVENNNKLFDKRLVGTFSPDVYKYFEVQTARLRGTATEADVAWMTERRNDPAFVSQLQTFGNFVHGTHVAGIAAQDASAAQVQVLKIIPTKTPQLPRMGLMGEINFLKTDIWDQLIRAGLAQLAKQQGVMFSNISAYLQKSKPQVANCSFGTSVTAVTPMLKQLIQGILRREPTEAEMKDYASYFVNSALEIMKKELFQKNPKTLFVIAAGNDGTDNDVLPVSPANAGLGNTLTVAATFDRTRLASFSNFGIKNVDVGAPGVGIRSSIPGNEYLTVNGTSQASPYVANIAGQVYDANPNLTPAQVKEVILGTVDGKDFLNGKVKTGGLANANRAIAAATLSQSLNIQAAIAQSRTQVLDIAAKKDLVDTGSEEALALPSTF
jgi:subtilisin family serine protease